MSLKGNTGNPDKAGHEQLTLQIFLLNNPNEVNEEYIIEY